MPRPTRNDYPDAWHHVVNRGIDHAAIERGDADRAIFLDLLETAAQRASLEIHAYCLLGNHYHPLLRSREGRLADGMKWLAGRFTQWINYRDGRDGPLFRGRYASVAMKTDAQLVLTSRNIHLNPVEAVLVREPADWVWPSAAAYPGHVATPPWLHTSTVLDLFSRQVATETYGCFLEQGVVEANGRRALERGPSAGMGADPQGLTPAPAVLTRLN